MVRRQFLTLKFPCAFQKEENGTQKERVNQGHDVCIDMYHRLAMSGIDTCNLIAIVSSLKTLN